MRIANAALCGRRPTARMRTAPDEETMRIQRRGESAPFPLASASRRIGRGPGGEAAVPPLADQASIKPFGAGAAEASLPNLDSVLSALAQLRSNAEASWRGSAIRIG